MITVHFNAPTGILSPWKIENPSEEQIAALITLGAKPHSHLSTQ